MESQVRLALNFLFVEHGALVVSNERLPGTGNSQMFVRVLDFYVRIIQKDGGLTVLAAPHHTRNGWHPIESLLKAIEPKVNFPPQPVYGSLVELGRLLEPRVLRLNEALSPAHFASTIQDSRESGAKELIALVPRTPIQMSLSRRLLIGMIRGIGQAIRFAIPAPKDKYAKLLPVDSDKELEEAVRQEFDTFFGRFGAHISSNGRLPIMDFAYVTFDVDNLRVRAYRDRGPVEVSVAPVRCVRDWNRLGIALLALKGGDEIPTSVPSSALRGAGRLLEAAFPELNEAFSDSQYAAIRERMRGIDESLKQRWLEEFNRTNSSYRATVS